MSYPDTAVLLSQRKNQPDQLTEVQGDTNWQDIQDALNYIKPVMAVLKANQGVGTAADAMQSLFDAMAKTGDLRWSIRNIVPSGWILCDDGFIGNDASTATYKGDIYQALYGYIWNFAVASDFFPATKGVSAIADWGANKSVRYDVCGRVLVAAGQGAGLTNRVFGTKFGQEYYTDARTYSISSIAVTGNTPAITWTPSITVPSTIVTVTGGQLSASGSLSVTGGTVTFPTWSAGTQAVVPTLSGAFPIWTAGSNGTTPTFPTIVLPTMSGAFPTFSAGAFPVPTGGAWSAGTPATISVTGIAGPGGDIALSFTTPTVSVGLGDASIVVLKPTEAGTVNGALIAAKLGTSASGYVAPSLTFQTLTAGTLPSMSAAFPTFNIGSQSGGSVGTISTVPTLSGAFPIWTAGSNGVAPSLSGGSNSVSGATVNSSGITIAGTITVQSQVITPSLTVPATALSGVTASGATQSNSVNIPTIQPSFATNLYIKI